MKINMPGGAKYIINTLEQAGYEAYIVGGCVRDAVLGKQPDDWDITTNARPEQIKALFKKTVDTGIKHGTVTVLTDRRRDPDNYAFEVTTYRVDGVYEDHRRPKEVTFSADLKEDLKRRDFTINAMAYSDKRGLVDIFGGQRDLADHVIRCVGNPDERFDEDALRILRAVRFSAKLNFNIEEKTGQAISAHAQELKHISAERIREELTKLLISDHPEKIRDAYAYGLTAVFLPEFDLCMKTEQNNPYHCYTVGEHIIKALENVPPAVHLRYAALLHDIEKPNTKTTDEKGIDHFAGHAQKGVETSSHILKRLKFDNDTIDIVKKLVKYHDIGLEWGPAPKEARVREFLSVFGPEHSEDLFLLIRGDMAGQSDYKLEERKQAVDLREEMVRTIIDRGDCLTIKDLAVNGKDLMNEGVPAGPKLGEALKKLLAAVLKHPEYNKRETLLKLLHEMGF